MVPCAHRIVARAAQKATPPAKRPESNLNDDEALSGVREYHTAASTRAPRFYIEDRTLLPTTEGSFFKLEGSDAQHALKVLRLRQGDRVELADGAGRLVLCEIESVSDRKNSDAAVRAVENVRAEEWTGTRFELIVACSDLQVRNERPTDTFKIFFFPLHVVKAWIRKSLNISY